MTEHTAQVPVVLSQVAHQFVRKAAHVPPELAQLRALLAQNARGRFVYVHP